eukprot:jgi/Mesvir1/12024/Mv00321-RA.3
MGELIRDNHWQHDATIGDLSAIRVVIVPIGGKSDELSKYASLVLANTSLELASVKSFYTEHESSPFVSQSWDTGQLRFRFMYTDGARISSLGANGQLPVEAMAPDSGALGSHFRLSRERSMSTNAMLAGLGADLNSGWAPRARQGAMLNVQNVKTAPTSPMFPNGLHASPGSEGSPGNGASSGGAPASSSMSARVRHLLQPRTLGNSASSPDLTAEAKSKSMAPGSYHGVYDDVQSNRKILGVIGVCFCPATPNIGEAYAEFLDICRYFHDALAVRCFCFDPTDAHVEQDDSSRQFLVLLPPGDTSYLEFHINTLMQDFGAALLMEAEKVVHALMQLLKAETLGVTPAASGESAGMLGGRSEELRLHKKRRITRLEKTIADYCLIAGSPADAFTYYASASESATMCNDLMWAAAAMEGTACCVYQQPKVLQPDDVESIITNYTQAIALYGRLTIGILELEAVFKLARFYAEAGNKQAAIQQVTSLMGMSGRMTLSARVSLFLEIAGVYESVGYYHKQVYHIREAALECRLAGSAQKALPLLLSTAEVYCRPNSSHCDWKALLQETLELAMQANDALTSWMAAVQLLREHHSDLSDEAQRSLLNDMVRCARLLPHGTQCTTPGLPLVRVLSYPAPPAHMWAVEWQRKKRASAGKGLFIYSPMDASAGKGGKKGRADAAAAASQPVVWIVGELGEVVVEMSNPCPFEVSVDCIHLITDHEDFEALPLTAYLPAYSKKIVTLVGVPRQAGQLKVLGCVVRCLGMLSEHRCGGSHAPDGSVVGADCAKAVTVVPPLPLLVPRLCSAAGRPLRPDSDKVVDATEHVGVYPGEVRKLTVLLRNIGATTVRQVDVTTLCRRGMLSVDASTLQRALPLAKGGSVLLPVSISAASSSLKEGASTTSSVTIEYTGTASPEESAPPPDSHPPSSLSKASSDSEAPRTPTTTAVTPTEPLPNGLLPNGLHNGASLKTPPTTSASSHAEPSKPAADKPAIIHGRELAISVEIEMQPGLRLLGTRVVAFEDAPPSVVRALVLASRGISVNTTAGAATLPRLASAFSFGAGLPAGPSASPYNLASAVRSPYAGAGASPYGHVGDATYNEAGWDLSGGNTADVIARTSSALSEVSLSGLFATGGVQAPSHAPSVAGTAMCSRQGSMHGGPAMSVAAESSMHNVEDNVVCVAPFVVDVAGPCRGGAAEQGGGGSEGGVASRSGGGQGAGDLRGSSGGNDMASGNCDRAGHPADHNPHPACTSSVGSTATTATTATTTTSNSFCLLEVRVRNKADYPFRIEAPCVGPAPPAPASQWVTWLADAIASAAGAVLGDTASLTPSSSALPSLLLPSSLAAGAGPGTGLFPGPDVDGDRERASVSDASGLGLAGESGNGSGDKLAPPPGGILIAANPHTFRAMRRYYDGDDYEGGSGGTMDAYNGNGGVGGSNHGGDGAVSRSVSGPTAAGGRSGSENLSRTESGLALGVPIAAEGIVSGKVGAAVDAAIAQLARAGVNTFTPRSNDGEGGGIGRTGSGSDGAWGSGVEGGRRRTWGDDSSGACVLCTMDPGEVARVFVPVRRQWLDRGPDGSSSSSSSGVAGSTGGNHSRSGGGATGGNISAGGSAYGPVTSTVLPANSNEGSGPGGGAALPPLAPVGGSVPTLGRSASLPQPSRRKRQSPAESAKSVDAGSRDTDASSYRAILDDKALAEEMKRYSSALANAVSLHWRSVEGNTGQLSLDAPLRSGMDTAALDALRPQLLSFDLDVTDGESLLPCVPRGELSARPQDSSASLDGFGSLSSFHLTGMAGGAGARQPLGGDPFMSQWEPLPGSGNGDQSLMACSGGGATGGHVGSSHLVVLSGAVASSSSRMRPGQVVDVPLGRPVDLSLWVGNASAEPLCARLGMTCLEVPSGADALVSGGSSASGGNVAASANPPTPGDAVMWMGCFQRVELELPCHGSTRHGFALCFLKKGLFSLVPRCEVVAGSANGVSTDRTPGHTRTDVAGGQTDLIEFSAAAMVPPLSYTPQATVVLMSEDDGSAPCQIDRVKDGEAFAFKRLCKGQPFFFQVV